ncbi:MAG: hypothetical protein GYA02_11825 [Clostridiaceae bacterium]|nr:hypothetical protein [Clostridiaceae bacterium]
MKIKFNNTDKWYKVYKKLNKEQKYKYILETVSCDLPAKFFEKIDILSFVTNTFGYLTDMKLYEEMIELYDRLYRWKEHIDEWYYLETFLIDYYLYCGNISEVKKHLESFQSEPVASIDIFIPVFDKLVYYGYSDLTLDISLRMFDKIKDAPGLLSGSERQFGWIIYMEKLQSVYSDLKRNIPVDRNAIVKYLEKYDFEPELYIDMTIDVLSPENELWPDYEIYQKDTSDFFHCLMLLFCRHMLDSKNVSFATSHDIWDVFTYCIRLDTPDSVPVMNYDNVFELDVRRYDDEISGRMGYISNKYTCGFAAAWGIVYIYDFLYNHGYISEGVYHDALETIQTIKIKIISGIANHLWKNNFVNIWGKPDSNAAEEFTSIKEIFDESFKRDEGTGPSSLIKS